MGVIRNCIIKYRLSNIYFWMPKFDHFYISSLTVFYSLNHKKYRAFRGKFRDSFHVFRKPVLWSSVTEFRKSDTVEITVLFHLFRKKVDWLYV